MPTPEELHDTFTREMKAIGFHYEERQYRAIMKHLGPSVHDADASLVACSDDSERATVKNNFLIGKLGMEDGPELDDAIQKVCEAMGESNTKKHRSTFYYLLVTILDKWDVMMAN